MGYETITTTIEPGAKFWVARLDGEKITKQQFEKLKHSIENKQGGPAHLTFKLQCVHWDEVEPISIYPERNKWEGRTNHEIWGDLMACMDAASEFNAAIFGHFHLTELIDGFWVEHFKFQIKRNEPESPEVLYAKLVYDKYED